MVIELENFNLFEVIAALANLCVLTLIGVLYFAYIRNLRSVVRLKDDQLKIAEQNVKLWKDTALELERKTPEFIEIKLSERIKIREEEITRLALDGENHSEEIATKNKEIEALKTALEKAYQYRKSFTVWDSEEREFKEIPYSDLEQQKIGSICVDTASLLICDPWYVKRNDELEKENIEAQENMYKIVETGEVFCTSVTDESNHDMELLGLDEKLTAKTMLEQGALEKLEYSGAWPAVPTTYIKGDLCDRDYRRFSHLTFINGRPGAGVKISLYGDGVYPVTVETYKGIIQRIVIDI